MSEGATLSGTLDSDDVKSTILKMSDEVFDCSAAQNWIGGALMMQGHQEAGLSLINMNEEEFTNYILNLLG